VVPNVMLRGKYSFIFYFFNIIVRDSPITLVRLFALGSLSFLLLTPFSSFQY
jgi:hypothetical protein